MRKKSTKSIIKETLTLAILAMALPFAVNVVWQLSSIEFFKLLLISYASAGYVFVLLGLVTAMLKTPFEDLSRVKKIKVYNNAFTLAWIGSLFATILRTFVEGWFA